ncbi:MAG: hypothetical protein ISR34_09380 [Pirellulales bacterium]|nr:hypothetical protein [Pirellulales bacterium]
MAKLHTFDAGSVKRIGNAVRWVEEYVAEDGIDLNAGAESTEVTDIENQGEGVGGNNFARLVSISDWSQGSSKTFTLTDTEGNSETITASNPFADAGAGSGVIVNCGDAGWVLVAATCKEDDDDTST